MTGHKRPGKMGPTYREDHDAAKEFERHNLGRLLSTQEPCSCYDHDGQKVRSLMCPVHGIEATDKRLDEARGLLRETLRALPNNDWRGNPYRKIEMWLSDNPGGGP